MWYNGNMVKSSSTTGWGYFQQGAELMEKIMELGKKLNLAIDCPIHYPAFGKRLFECRCGIIFSAYVVEGHSSEELAKIHGRKKELD